MDELLERLEKITGLEKNSGVPLLIDSDKLMPVYFFNSGSKIMPVQKTGFDIIDLGPQSHLAFSQGSRINPTILTMSRDALHLPPHCHPGGEIAYVVQGEYFDANLNGLPIQTYDSGSLVVYGLFSTHRPLSRTGAKIFYIPFNGIVFPSKSQELSADDPYNLVRKMKDLGAPLPALEYAREWMHIRVQ